MRPHSVHQPDTWHYLNCDAYYNKNDYDKVLVVVHLLKLHHLISHQAKELHRYVSPSFSASSLKLETISSCFSSFLKTHSESCQRETEKVMVTLRGCCGCSPQGLDPSAVFSRVKFIESSLCRALDRPRALAGRIAALRRISDCRSGGPRAGRVSAAKLSAIRPREAAPPVSSRRGEGSWFCIGTTHSQ